MELVAKLGRSGHQYRELCDWVKRTYTHCWLCGRSVDMTLSGRHRDGPTVDHVIPLSLGGSALSPDNVRLAHHKCNSGRGARIPQTVSRRW